jgi:hypothetical protein
MLMASSWGRNRWIELIDSMEMFCFEGEVKCLTIEEYSAGLERMM